MKLSKQEQKRQPLAWKEWGNKKECQYYNKDFGMCNLKLIIVNEKECKECDLGEYCLYEDSIQEKIKIYEELLK